MHIRTQSAPNPNANSQVLLPLPLHFIYRIDCIEDLIELEGNWVVASVFDLPNSSSSITYYLTSRVALICLRKAFRLWWIAINRVKNSETYSLWWRRRWHDKSLQISPFWISYSKQRGWRGPWWTHNVLTVGKLREPRWRMLICLGVLGDDEQFYTLWNVNYFRESCNLVPRVLSLIVFFPPTIFSVRYFAAVPNGRTKFRNWVRQKYGVGIEVFN